MDWVEIEEGRVKYPEGSLVKTMRLHNCFEVTGHGEDGVHKVRSVGAYLGSKEPPSELKPEEIYGMADNECRLIVHGDEVLFSDEFEAFKEISDELLGELPKKEIEEFTESDDFSVYRKVMENGVVIPYKMRKRFVQMVDDLLGELPTESVNKFIDSELYVKYARVAEHYKVT